MRDRMVKPYRPPELFPPSFLDELPVTSSVVSALFATVQKVLNARLTSLTDPIPHVRPNTAYG